MSEGVEINNVLFFRYDPTIPGSSCRCEHSFENALNTTTLQLRIHATHGTPVAVFRVRVFG